LAAFAAISLHLKQLSPAAKDLVQRVLKMRRTFGQLAANLLDEFLVALLDLLAEELSQRAIAQAVLLLLRMIRHQVRDQRAREASGSLAGVSIEKRID
jgi:hypothetical protein